MTVYERNRELSSAPRDAFLFFTAMRRGTRHEARMDSTNHRGSSMTHCRPGRHPHLGPEVMSTQGQQAQSFRLASDNYPSVTYVTEATRWGDVIVAQHLGAEGGKQERRDLAEVLFRAVPSDAHVDDVVRGVKLILQVGRKT